MDKKTIKKATVKKVPKEEKLIIEFDRKNYEVDDVRKCMQKHTSFDFTVSDKKDTTHFSLKVDKSSDPDENTFYNKESIVGIIDSHIDNYKEKRLALERTRKCIITELDGRFYIRVTKNDWIDDDEAEDDEHFEIFL